MSSYCVLTNLKHLQHIAVSLAVILYLEQSSSSHDRAYTDLRVRLEYFVSSALWLEELGTYNLLLQIGERVNF